MGIRAVVLLNNSTLRRSANACIQQQRILADIGKLADAVCASPRMRTLGHRQCNRFKWRMDLDCGYFSFDLDAEIKLYDPPNQINRHHANDGRKNFSTKFDVVK